MRIRLLLTLLCVAPHRLFAAAPDQGVAPAQSSSTLAASSASSSGEFTQPKSSMHYGLTEATNAWMEGRSVSATIAEGWEMVIAEKPDQPALRARLISYYDTHGRDDLRLRIKRNEQILWMIEHHPNSPYAGEHAHMTMFGLFDGADAVKAARDAWLLQVDRHPEDVQVLGNAAAFLQHLDQPASERLLRKAQRVEARSPKWHAKLGRLFLLQTMTTDHGVKYSAASKALQEFEKAKLLTLDEDGQLQFMDELVRSSYMVDRLDKTKDYATFWMKKVPAGQWDFSDAQHYGHSALGLLALKAKDLKGAKNELAMSADHQGSPLLNSFGPCMDLADALIKQGHTDAVVDYLEACGKFWKSGEEKLAEWTKAIEAGNRPDFTGHFSF